MTTIHNLDGGTGAISQISTMTSMNLTGRHLRPNKQRSFSIMQARERNHETTTLEILRKFYGANSINADVILLLTAFSSVVQ
jgi:hypothetical protein